MYNIRKKLWFIMLLLFIISPVMLRLSPRDKPGTVTASTYSDTAQAFESGVWQDDGRERFVAHRGYSNYAPENSIPAFELAGKHGFWGIETDISETTDGQFVCMHDEELNRTTNGTGLVTDYSLDQLDGFKIDRGNNVEVTENLKIPTLSEYLEICLKYRCVAVVEIKSVKNYDEFLNVIHNSGMTSGCIITGNINDMLEIRARNSEIPVMTIGYAPAPYTDNLVDIAQIPDNRGVLYNYPQVDKAAIDTLHQQNIYCGVWSVDDKNIAEEYLSYGADYVVTNEIPARLQYDMLNEN